MNRYWFRTKRYGVGASPSSWEGWTASAGCVLAIAMAALWVPTWFPDPGKGRIAGLAAAWIIIVAFLGLVWKKTEGPWRWRWGDDD